MRYGIVGLIVAGAAVSSSAHGGDVAAAFRACASYAVDEQRLACYDLIRCSLETDSSVRLECYDAVGARQATSVGEIRTLLLEGPGDAPAVAPAISPATPAPVPFARLAGAIGQCWNIDRGASDLPVVEIRLRVDPATAAPIRESIEIVSGDGPEARAAQRAILNAACQPWPAPAGGWPTEPFVLRFDPRSMF